MFSDLSQLIVGEINVGLKHFALSAFCVKILNLAIESVKFWR